MVTLSCRKIEASSVVAMRPFVLRGLEDFGGGGIEHLPRPHPAGGAPGLLSLKAASAVSAARRLATSPLLSPPTPSASSAMLPSFCARSKSSGSQNSRKSSL